MLQLDWSKDVQKSKMRTRLISKCKYYTLSTSYYIQMLHSDAIWMSLVIAETWGPIGSRIGDMTSRFANVEGFSADKSGLWSFTCTMKEWTSQDSENDRRTKRFFFISSYLVQLNLKPFAHDSLCLHCVSISSCCTFGAFGASDCDLWMTRDLPMPLMSPGGVQTCPLDTSRTVQMQTLDKIWQNGECCKFGKKGSKETFKRLHNLDLGCLAAAGREALRRCAWHFRFSSQNGW